MLLGHWLIFVEKVAELNEDLAYILILRYLAPVFIGCTWAYFYWPKTVRSAIVTDQDIVPSFPCISKIFHCFKMISHPGLSKKVRRDYRELERVEVIFSQHLWNIMILENID